MKRGIVAIALLLGLAPAALQAQSPAPSSMREKLMPTGAALTLTAPVADLHTAAPVRSPAVAHGNGMAYMIAGGALFVGGLIAGGDGGTVLILAGAGIGAYGLYLYFR